MLATIAFPLSMFISGIKKKKNFKKEKFFFFFIPEINIISGKAIVASIFYLMLLPAGFSNIHPEHNETA